MRGVYLRVRRFWLEVRGMIRLRAARATVVAVRNERNETGAQGGEALDETLAVAVLAAILGNEVKTVAVETQVRAACGAHERET